MSNDMDELTLPVNVMIADDASVRTLMLRLKRMILRDDRRSDIGKQVYSRRKPGALQGNNAIQERISSGRKKHCEACRAGAESVP